MIEEIKLLKIAQEVIDKNNGLNAKLSGSLMLYNMDLKKRRPATDIDIICNFLCEKPDDDGFPWVPNGFKLADIDGSRSQVDAIQFTNDEGLKIEFMTSEEMGEIVDGIPCADLSRLVLAKLRYAKGDKTSDSRDKHLEDLVYLFENNLSLQIC